MSISDLEYNLSHANEIIKEATTIKNDIELKLRELYNKGLVKKILDLANETNVENREMCLNNITAISINGGPFIDYGDNRVNTKHKVCIEYVYNGETLRFEIKDNNFNMYSSYSKYLLFNVFMNLIDGDAKNFYKLIDDKYFIEGDPEWFGSGLKYLPRDCCKYKGLSRKCIHH